MIFEDYAILFIHTFNRLVIGICLFNSRIMSIGILKEREHKTVKKVHVLYLTNKPLLRTDINRFTIFLFLQLLQPNKDYCLSDV